MLNFVAIVAFGGIGVLMWCGLMFVTCCLLLFLGEGWMDGWVF